MACSRLLRVVPLLIVIGVWGCRATTASPLQGEPAPTRTVLLPAATGRLQVSVRDSARGMALGGAVGRAWVSPSVAFAPQPTPLGAGGDTLSWPTLPTGDYVVVVRRIAYEPVRREVRIDSGQTAVVEVRLALSDMCDLACSAVVIAPRRWWQFWRR